MFNQRSLRNLLLPAGLAALLLTGTAYSQSPRGDFDGEAQRPRQRRSRMMRAERPSIAKQLGLTEEQQEKLRTLRTDARKNRIQSQADMRIKRLEMAEIMRADEPDRAAIERKLDEIAAARKTQFLAGLDHRNAMKAILTPEQLEKMKTLRRNSGHNFRRNRRGPGRGNRFHRKGRPGSGGSDRPHRGPGNFSRPGMGLDLNQDLDSKVILPDTRNQ